MARGMIGLEFNSKQLERALRTFSDRAPTAIARALNRAGVSTRTVMVRKCAQHLKMQNKYVGRSVRVDEASTTRFRVRIYAFGRPIPLIAFRARGPYPSRGKGAGVTVTLPHGRALYRRAFIAQMKSGHRGVFMRQGRARLPIKQLFGPSIADAFEAYRREGVAAGRESLVKNLRHELKWAMTQARQGS